MVFIQFQGAVRRELIAELRERFAAAGFAAPGIERITTPFTSGVRYFHAQDSALADSAAAIGRDFLQEKLPSITAVPVQNLAGRKFRVPRGQIEVWLEVP